MLLRYSRSQFLDPNAGYDNWAEEVAESKNFYDSDEVRKNDKLLRTNRLLKTLKTGLFYLCYYNMF